MPTAKSVCYISNNTYSASFNGAKDAAYTAKYGHPPEMKQGKGRRKGREKGRGGTGKRKGREGTEKRQRFRILGNLEMGQGRFPDSETAQPVSGS